MVAIDQVKIRAKFLRKSVAVLNRDSRIIPAMHDADSIRSWRWTLLGVVMHIQGGGHQEQAGWFQWARGQQGHISSHAGADQQQSAVGWERHGNEQLSAVIR